MAYAVSFSLLASLRVAVTLVPMLLSTIIPQKILQPTKTSRLDRVGNVLMAKYRKLLKWAPGHRKTVVLTTLVLLVGSFLLTPLIGMEFFPASDQGQFQITVETATGSKLEETRQIVDQVNTYLQAY